MQILSIILLLLSAFSFFIAIVGIFSPKRALPKEENPTRKKAFFTFFGISFVTFLIGAVLAPTDNSMPSLTPQTATENLSPEEQQQALITEWLSLSELSPEDYARICQSAPDGAYKQQCKGKAVTWYGFINEVADVDKLEVRVGPEHDSKAFDLDLINDLDASEPLERFKDQKILFRAVVDSNSGFDHDLDQGTFITVALTNEESEAILQEQEAAKIKLEQTDTFITEHIECRKQFKANANHPSTVDFPLVDLYHASEIIEDGSHIIQGSASAKNSFNTELEFTYQCIFKDQQFVTINIREK
ncbi:hypothetical protein [Kiloniella laminariae]|uniref:hypothetical protein n=1 Tax=Kiloniella laminariae TaxID=454162 RepID=UPI00035E8F0C|nr:hypothetical protein [Kiloniella laminariae]